MASTSTTDNPASAGVDRDRAQPLAPFATGPVLGIAAVAAASMLAFATRYGYHRDELYFIAAGRRLDSGYVDQPPLTPIVARAADVLFGHSLFGLRAVTALLVALGVIAVALLARELGGGRTAQMLAAFTVAASPLLRGHNKFLGTTGLDQLMWAVVLLSAARLVRTENPRWWIAVGAGIGLGLETKATMLVLVVGLLAGVVLDRRWSLLRSWWFLGGVGVALAIWLPNLVWNATNDWAMVTFSEGKHSHPGDPVMHTYFLLGQVLMTGITTIFVWVPGCRWLADRSGPGRRFRPVAIAVAVVLVAFFAMGAKYYYSGPVYFVLFAAGAVALEAGVRRARIIATWMVAASVVLLAPVTMPLADTGNVDNLVGLSRDYPSMVGWPEMADQVQSIVASLPAEEQEHTVVFAVNYGEAGAIEHFAPDLDVYSGHNSYWLWGPPPDSATTAVLVGFRDVVPDGLCNDPEQVGTVANDAGLDNFESGQPIWLCRDLVRPWSEAWPRQKQYT